MWQRCRIKVGLVILSDKWKLKTSATEGDARVGSSLHHLYLRQEKKKKCGDIFEANQPFPNPIVNGGGTADLELHLAPG